MPEPRFTATDVAAAFPEYAVGDRALGVGGHKAAFRATSPTDERVLKIVLEPNSEQNSGDLEDIDDESESYSDRFSRELTAMSEIDCAHIVKLLSPPSVRAIAGRDHVYYEEPYYSGGTLMEAFQSGALTERNVIKLGISLLKAIEVLWQEKQAVHRDINPRNIMYDANGTVVLIDLGIALFTTMSDVTGTGMNSPGTRKYAAPEQFQLRRNVVVDTRTDMFLIGMVLFEALTGRHPFVNTNADYADLLDRLESFDLRSLAEVECAPVLKDVIARLLAGSQSRRYKTASEPISILEGLL